jgi:hypothetical protein
MYWRKIEKIIRTVHVKNEVLHRLNEEVNIKCTMKRKKDNWVGHILRRNYLLRHVVEGKIGEKIEMMGGE